MQRRHTFKLGVAAQIEVPKALVGIHDLHGSKISSLLYVSPAQVPCVLWAFILKNEPRARTDALMSVAAIAAQSRAGLFAISPGKKSQTVSIFSTVSIGSGACLGS